MTTFARKLIASATTVVALVLASACSGSEGTKEKPLDPTQAAILAEALSRNFEAGGATFTVSAAAGPSGGTITVSGDVDWKNHRGHALVSGGMNGNPVTEVWWDQSQVIERRPDLDTFIGTMLDQMGEFVITRDVDQDHRRLDQLIAIVVGLASTQPDNAQLIQQAEGSAYVRDDVLNGSPVQLLRYGQRSTYWMDLASGEMLRLEASDASGAYPVIVDLAEKGERTIEYPADYVVVHATDLGDLFGSMAPTSP